MKQPACVVVAALMAVFLGVLTYQRAPIFRDDYTLWSATVQASPLSTRATANFALAALRIGHAEEGLLAMQRAMALACDANLAALRQPFTSAPRPTVFGGSAPCR